MLIKSRYRLAREHESANVLVPYFQRIVDPGHQDVIYELLCRTHDCSCMPQQTIHQWELTGEIAMVDITMLRYVLAAYLSDVFPANIKVAINVSARTIELAAPEYLSLLSTFEERLASRLILEITETYEACSAALIEDFIFSVKRNNIAVALDDCSPDNCFYKSSMMQQMAPDYLKIDGKFFGDCHDVGNADQLLELLAISKLIGAIVIVEWVDSQAKFDFASSLNIRLFQGWMFSVPSRLDGLCD